MMRFTVSAPILAQYLLLGEILSEFAKKMSDYVNSGFVVSERLLKKFGNLLENFGRGMAKSATV